MKKINNIFKPADRIGNVEEYYFSVKLKEVAAMRAAGDDVINLGIGSPDLAPSEDVINTLVNEAANINSHGYQSYIGIAELREAFASWYKTWYNVTLNPTNEILPLMGSKEGIMHITMAFVNEGDSVLIPDPGYPTYTSVSKLVDANILKYNLLEENNWEPDFASLEALHNAGKINLHSVKLMWCNYPNMPTGAAASKDLFKKIVDFGLKWSIIICHDNPYSFILNNNPLSILSVEGAKDICIELNSLSKASNMPGWRVGMLASNSTFIDWILRVKSNMDSGMFKPVQLAAVQALMLPSSWYANMNSVYSSRRVLARQILQLVGCEVRENQVGLFLWGKVSEANNVSGREICDKLLYDKKIFLTPGFIFGKNGEKYIRISLCCSKELLKKVILRLEK